MCLKFIIVKALCARPTPLVELLYDPHMCCAQDTQKESHPSLLPSLIECLVVNVLAQVGPENLEIHQHTAEGEIPCERVSIALRKAWAHPEICGTV